MRDMLKALRKRWYDWTTPPHGKWIDAEKARLAAMTDDELRTEWDEWDEKNWRFLHDHEGSYEAAQMREGARYLGDELEGRGIPAL